MNHSVDEFHRLYYNSPDRTWQNTFWLGVGAQKCPLDLWIYQEIIFQMKPDIIIETGTANGGSALFLASVCDLLNNGQVLSIDIEEKEGRPIHKRILYLHGSSVEEAIVHQVKEILQGKEKIMVILDSDHHKEHVLDELKIYSKFVNAGNYLIVEDTNVNDHPVVPDFGPGPMEAVEEFLMENKDFVIDHEGEKFFLTFNPKGFLKKIGGSLGEKVKADGDMEKRVVRKSGLPPAESSVYYHDELQVYYPGVQFGIDCAVANPAYVKIEPGVIMAHHSSMTAITGYNGRYYRPTITVGEATQIGPYNAFAAIDRVTIGRCVLFAPYVHVSDHSHGFQDVSRPVMHQPVFSNGPVVIEDGCWLGFGSHILSGVTIGKNSVVGANSLVTENIPPYSVAVGSPAKIIKRFNFGRKRWEEVQNSKVDHPGNDLSSPWDLLRRFLGKKMRRIL